MVVVVAPTIIKYLQGRGCWERVEALGGISSRLLLRNRKSQENFAAR